MFRDCVNAHWNTLGERFPPVVLLKDVVSKHLRGPTPVSSDALLTADCTLHSTAGHRGWASPRDPHPLQRYQEAAKHTVQKAPCLTASHRMALRDLEFLFN
ncbi:Hypothetical predicted protein [Scomber scombrus]|uniref:Uncharacterized protein n=1 Tax=Scomber scombrus TaxID=13677 RepID=A0AAV1N7N7_SCOSC